MAKKFGKRGKKKGAAEDPRNMFGPPMPRRGGPPASSTPLADFLDRGPIPGVDEGYVVLPRSLAEGMSLPWQQQTVELLSQFHGTHRGLSWPIYRVTPSRYERLVDLDEEQLAEAGYLVEIDMDGDMVYRERSGRRVENPESTTVLVATLDPIVRQRPPARPRQEAPVEGGSRAPVPMNLPPAPVWRTTPAKPDSSAAPPLPVPEPPKNVAPAPNREAPPAAARPDFPPMASQQQPPAAAAQPQAAESQPPTAEAGSQPPVAQPPAAGAQASAEPKPPLPIGFAEPAPQAQPSASWSTQPPEQQAPARQPEPQAPPAQPEAPAPPQPLNPPLAPGETAASTSGQLPVIPPATAKPVTDLDEPFAVPAAQPPDNTANTDDTDTPPRGLRLPVDDRGWFDELPDSASAASSSEPPQEETTFGPSGDPTEIPYRYRK